MVIFPASKVDSLCPSSWSTAFYMTINLQNTNSTIIGVLDWHAYDARIIELTMIIHGLDVGLSPEDLPQDAHFGVDSDA